MGALTSEEMTASAIKAYPNPTTMDFGVEGTGQESFSVTLFDGIGRPVKRWAHVSGSARFDVSGSHSGCYTLLVELNNGRSQHLMLIIE